MKSCQRWTIKSWGITDLLVAIGRSLQGGVLVDHLVVLVAELARGLPVGIHDADVVLSNPELVTVPLVVCLRL